MSKIILTLLPIFLENQIREAGRTTSSSAELSSDLIEKVKLQFKLIIAAGILGFILAAIVLYSCFRLLNLMEQSLLTYEDGKAILAIIYSAIVLTGFGTVIWFLISMRSMKEKIKDEKMQKSTSTGGIDRIVTGLTEGFIEGLGKHKEKVII